MDLDPSEFDPESKRDIQHWERKIEDANPLADARRRLVNNAGLLLALKELFLVVSVLFS
jgi:hypothetical protein